MFGGKSFFSFSKRQGLEPMEKPVQLDNMDNELRNRLWRAFYSHFIENKHNQAQRETLKLLWVQFFKWPADTLPLNSSAYQQIRERYFAMPYNHVYDFLMFLVQYSSDPLIHFFKLLVNQILEDEFSGYRFIDDYIAPITNNQEIQSIQNAISSGIGAVKNHLKTALHYLSDKDARDYRNSIKESISAVESLCALIVGDPNATLGAALKQIAKNGIVELHPSLKAAYEKIHGYTSNADGIRHSMTDIPKVRFEDAQYMLVSSSAFINYLIAKADAAGIKLNKTG